jgi:hypothetical protein
VVLPFFIYREREVFVKLQNTDKVFVKFSSVGNFCDLGSVELVSVGEVL